MGKDGVTVRKETEKLLTETSTQMMLVKVSYSTLIKCGKKRERSVVGVSKRSFPLWPIAVLSLHQKRKKKNPEKKPCPFFLVVFSPIVV